MPNRNCAGATYVEPLLRAAAYQGEEEKRCPTDYWDVEGGAGFEPTTSGCARRCASKSTSRPCRRQIGGASFAQTFGNLLIDHLALTSDHMTDDRRLFIILFDHVLTGPQALPAERRPKFVAHGLAVFAM